MAFLPEKSKCITLNQAMKTRKVMVNKWKKALFSAALGMLCGALFAIILYWLTGQSLYLAIIGFGAGMGLALGSGLSAQGLSDSSNRKS